MIHKVYFLCLCLRNVNKQLYKQKTYFTIASTRLDVPTKFQINWTWNGKENSSFLKPDYSRYRQVFLFACLQYKQQLNLKTKTCMLIWDSNPRFSLSFSSTGLRTAERLLFLSIPNNKQTTTTDMNLRGQVKPQSAATKVAADKKMNSKFGGSLKI